MHENSYCSLTLLVGRALLAQIFLLSGLMKLLHWSETAAHMTAEGLPVAPLFLALAIAIELGAGALVLLGFKARLAALALVLFLVPVTLVFHGFWKYQGEEQQNQLQHFLKNIALMGGLLTLAGAGAGRFSLDAARSRGEARATLIRQARRAAVPDLVDESSEESFPASDPPARTPVHGIGPPAV